MRACGGRPGAQQELNHQAGRGRTVEKPRPQQPLSLLTPALVGIPTLPHVWPEFPFLRPNVWALLREASLNRARGILPSPWHGFSPTPAARCLTSSYSRAWGVPKGEAGLHSPAAHKKHGRWERPMRRIPLQPHWSDTSCGTGAGRGLARKDQVLNLGPEDGRMKPPLYFIFLYLY